MRGTALIEQQAFSYVDLEARLRRDGIDNVIVSGYDLVNEALSGLERQFAASLSRRSGGRQSRRRSCCERYCCKRFIQSARNLNLPRTRP